MAQAAEPEEWPNTAFIGVGAMGQPMASQLARAGIPLLVSDADVARAYEVADHIGAEVISARDQYRDVGVVILMLPDSAAVESAVHEDPGLDSLLAEGSLIIDMSSSDPRRTVALSKQLAKHGPGLIDAPVSGGVSRARTGELAIMVGGSDDLVARAEPLLAVLGAKTFHTGPVGTGHAMKCLNNLLSAIGLLGASEVLSIGAKFGLAPDVMLNVLNESTGRNHATENKCAQYILSREFDSGFAMRLMVKDLGTALSMAESLEMDTPLAGQCSSIWAAALDQLGVDSDHTEIARFVEQANSVELS